MSRARQLLIILVSGLCSVVAAEGPYQEPFRPQFHFTPATNWMNDPNGMVYYDGEYHLFYQYNPWGDKWGHMSWGHAVSADLVRWEHLPVGLYEENNIMIFSGSTVVDWKNTTGFGKDGKPPLIAIYTGHYTKRPLQNQQIAFSNDRGRTWTKFTGNPVLDIGEADFRDPKVMWHEGSGRWVMTVAWPAHRKVRFFASRDMKGWSHLSDFGPAGSTEGIWECPDLFQLNVEGTRERKWVLVVNVGSGAPAGGSGCQYFVGDFDGTKFTLDPSYPKMQPEVVPEGKLLADFEGSDYADWRASGEAFGRTPAMGTLANQQPVSGFRGKGLINTFLRGDASQGALTSPEFEVSEPYINFLIGGGNHAARTCMNLLLDGQIVRTATGGNAEQLAWKHWDVRELRGRKVRLEIVDRETGGWGHINVDHIMLADRPARPATPPSLWADFGPDFYAAVSWSDVPREDGRPLWLGWMSNWQYANDVPTSPWRSAMSFPRELQLRRTASGLRLVQQPVRELESLRGRHHQLTNATMVEVNEWLRRENVAGSMWEIEAEIEPKKEATDFGLRLFQGQNQETVISCNLDRQVLSFDRTRSGQTGFHPRFAGIYEAPFEKSATARLRILVDTSSVEVFANRGQSVLTALVLPGSSNQPIQLWSTGDNLTVREMNVWKLTSAVPIKLQTEKR